MAKLSSPSILKIEEIYDELAHKYGITRKDVENIVLSQFHLAAEVIESAIKYKPETYRSVNIKNLGKFVPNDVKIFQYIKRDYPDYESRPELQEFVNYLKRKKNTLDKIKPAPPRTQEEMDRELQTIERKIQQNQFYGNKPKPRKSIPRKGESGRTDYSTGNSGNSRNSTTDTN